MLREILLILVFIKYVFLKYFWRLKTIVFMALILGQPWTTPHIDTNNHKNQTAPNPWLSSNKNTERINSINIAKLKMKLLVWPLHI